MARNTALLTGHCGLIPVFPWTTRHDVENERKRIHRAIGRQRYDAENESRSQRADWLHANGFDRADIVDVLWPRHRRSEKERMEQDPEAKADFDKEEAEVRNLMAQGLSWSDAQDKVHRRHQNAGHSSIARTAASRHQASIARVNAELASPVESNPCGHAVTMLLRELLLEHWDGLPAPVKQHAISLRDSLVNGSDPHSATP